MSQRLVWCFNYQIKSFHSRQFNFSCSVKRQSSREQPTYTTTLDGCRTATDYVRLGEHPGNSSTLEQLDNVATTLQNTLGQAPRTVQQCMLTGTYEALNPIFENFPLIPSWQNTNPAIKRVYILLASMGKAYVVFNSHNSCSNSNQENIVFFYQSSRSL